MKKTAVKSGIYWVGAIDWNIRNFHGYSTNRGTTYNSYLVEDQKTVLVDTVKRPFLEEMLERVRAVTDISKVDYVVSSHAEMDHSGCLPEIMKLCPRATVITSPNGEKSLKKHYSHDWKVRVVNSGDKVIIGKRTLNFLLIPMVHWPDSMATYIPEDKLLLPNDAFGQHIASVERFDDQVEWEVLRSEAAKYYANIVLPYGAQVAKALEAVSGLDIDMIAPSHGIIWKERISEIAELYTKWSSNTTLQKAVIVYDTMWNSTGKIAEAVRRAFDENSIKALPMNLSFTHISDVMTELLDAKYICVGSPTLNNGILPTVASFLAYMKGLAPRNRKGLSFGSYGWGGQSVGIIDDELKGCGFDMFNSVKERWVPSREELCDITERVAEEISKGG